MKTKWGDPQTLFELLPKGLPFFFFPSLPPSPPWNKKKNACRLAGAVAYCIATPLPSPSRLEAAYPAYHPFPPPKKGKKNGSKLPLFKPWQAPAGLSALRHFGSASLSCWQSHWHQRHFSHTVRPLSAPRLPARPNHLVWTTDCLAGWLYASHAPASDNKQEVIHRA